MAGFEWTSERIRDALGLPAGGPSRRYSGVSTDTRTLRPGELFVALTGERFDGTDFLGAAVEAGAPGAVVERKPADTPPDLELFRVDDALTALGRLATVRRRAVAPTVVAVTGTSGKTTTRAFMAAVLGERAYQSPGNYNNLIGVPLSMLRAPEEAEIWVLELASNQPGEIERLGRICEADIGVITTVSEGHLEGLGDLAGVLEEKLSLLDTLRPGATVIVGEQPETLVRETRRRVERPVVAGLGREADERPEDWQVTPGGLVWRWRGAAFDHAGFGEHLLRDALLALAVARTLGVEPDDAAARIGDARLPPMRGEVREVGGLTLLVDCYNANPASFSAALDALAGLAAGRRTAVVAGTMLELGPAEERLHREVARRIAEADVDLIAATGEFAPAFDDLGDRLGERLVRTPDVESAYAELSPRLHGDEVVLLKGSRGVRLERLIPMFERDFADPRRMKKTCGNEA